MFTISITMIDPPAGSVAKISNFKCGYCRHEAMIDVGVFDKENREDRETIIEKLKNDAQPK